MTNPHSNIPTDEEFLAQLAAAGIPEHLRDGLTRWVLHGIEPGSFLKSIISNDLLRAVARADVANEAEFCVLIRRLVLCIPEAAIFNPRALHDWPLYIKARRNQVGLPNG